MAFRAALTKRVGPFPRWTLAGIVVVIAIASVTRRLIPVAVGAALFILVRMNRPVAKPGASRGTWLALTLLTLGPVGLGLLVLFVTPTYFRPLLRSPSGAGILIALVVVAAASYTAVQFGTRQGFKGHVAVGSSLVAVALLLSGATLLLILLGPTVAILLTPRQS
jgi:hypothetical protein